MGIFGSDIDRSVNPDIALHESFLEQGIDQLELEVEGVGLFVSMKSLVRIKLGSWIFVQAVWRLTEKDLLVDVSGLDIVDDHLHLT